MQLCRHFGSLGQAGDGHLLGGDVKGSQKLGVIWEKPSSQYLSSWNMIRMHTLMFYIWKNKMTVI